MEVAVTDRVLIINSKIWREKKTKQSSPYEDVVKKLGTNSFYNQGYSYLWFYDLP